MKACANRSFSQQYRCFSSSSRSSVGRRSPCRAPPRAQARRAARRRRNAAARPLRRPSRTPATLRRAATLRAAPSRRRPSWRRQQWHASATRTDASCRRIAATRSTPTDRSAGVTLAAIARPRDGAKRSPRTAARATRSASNFSPRPPYAEEGCRTTSFPTVESPVRRLLKSTSQAPLSGRKKLLPQCAYSSEATRAPPVAGRDTQGPCSINYSSSTKRRESGPSLKRNLSLARCLALVCDSPSNSTANNRVETLIP